MKLLQKLLPLLFCILTMPVWPQPFAIEKMGLDKGLSDNYILCIAQDKQGFMWFGTEWGLNSFDGHSFKSYKADPLLKNTVSHNGINKLLVDPNSNLLYIATKEGGLNAYNSIDQTFIHYPIHTQSPLSTKANGITDLCFDREGNIWIATYKDGLKKLDRKANRVIHYDLGHLALPDNYKIKSIWDDHHGTLYIGHWGNGLTVLATNTMTGKHYTHNPTDAQSLPGNEVMDICIDTRNNVWLGTHNGLALFNRKAGTFTVFRYDVNNPNGLTNDDIHALTEIDGQLWIGTWKGGVNILDLATADLSAPQKVRFGHIAPNDLPTGLSSPSIEEIYKDAFGNIWMGTSGEGLNIIGHARTFFQKLSYSPLKSETNGLSGKTVNCLTIDADGLLWVGLGNGDVDVFRPNAKARTFDKLKTLFLDNYILCAMADSRSNLWFGRNMGGPMRYDTSQKLLQKPGAISNHRWAEYTGAVYEDDRHNIWLGTNNGILIYTPSTNGTKAVDGKEIGLPDNYIRNIVQDGNGNFWIGSEINGVSVVTPNLQPIHNFGQGRAMKSNTINHLFRDSHNRIWVATKNGLAFFPHVDKQNYNCTVLDQSAGLNDNYVRAVAEGRNGETWISTNAGISRYDEQSGKVENFDYNDGIPYGTFKNGAVATSADGTLFFGSQAGICYFNPNDGNNSPALPPPAITGLQVYGSKEESSDTSTYLPVHKEIDLAHSQNTLTIDFNVMDFALRNRTEYAYRLQGINDNGWHSTNQQNHVTFRNLSPGTYTFNVRARIRNREWSDRAAGITFTIHPPVWLSWWAKTVYSLAMGLIAFAILFFYRRKLKLESQLYVEKQNHLREQEINNERLQFFTHVAHELRTPLTLILGPLEELLRQSEQNTDANKKLSLIHKSANRLLNLINQLLEFRKSEGKHRQLTVRKGNLSALLREIVQKYQELNKNKEVSVGFVAQTAADLYFDQEVVTIIMDNLLSNALKNTPQGTVNVVARTTTAGNAPLLEVEVTDTGIGIPGEALDKIFDRYYQVKRDHRVQGTGIGLALVKNMVQLHHATIEVKSTPNRGTSFFVRFKTGETYPDALHIESPNTINEHPGDNAPLLLIVEDNDDLRNYMSDIFAGSYDVITANDGQEGIRLASERIPDVIVSDIMMPITDGMELCRTLKADLRTSHIPIVLLTAKDSEQDKTDGYATGADSYLTKPFSAALLSARVNNLLRGREKLAGYFSSGMYKKELATNALSALDNDFIQQTISAIEENIGLEQIDIAFLADRHNMSYSAFARKMKAVTGMTANDFVRDIRLQNAEQMLLSRRYTISEIVFRTGYNSMAYFRKSFKEKYGVSPSEYLRNLP